jgi:ribosome-binding factor A
MISPNCFYNKKYSEGVSEMPVPRARQYHRDRVAESLREEVSAIIEGELSDPRISFCYITEVLLNPGGKSARVYVAVDGGLQEETDTIEALMNARGHIRHSLMQQMGTRYVPDLSFHADRSEKMKGRIDELLGRKRIKNKPVQETTST